MPQIKTEFEELPGFKDLNVGDRLEIVGVEIDKTEKKQYDCFTFTLADGSKRFGTESGVIYQLENVDIESVSVDDPLKVIVTDYKDKFGVMRLSIKNALD